VVVTVINVNPDDYRAGVVQRFLHVRFFGSALHSRSLRSFPVPATFEFPKFLLSDKSWIFRRRNGSRRNVERSNNRTVFWFAWVYSTDFCWLLL